MAELKPCPCCGAEVEAHGGPEEWTPTYNDPDSGGEPYYIECTCGLYFTVPGCSDYGDFETAWNKRADIPVRTNADWIGALSIQRLAEFIGHNSLCDRIQSEGGSTCEDRPVCTNCVEDWLRLPKDEWLQGLLKERDE